MIPDFTADDVLPHHLPFPTSDGVTLTPWPTTSGELVTRFVNSPHRATLARRWLTMRADLVAAGLTVGVQWIDGSFTERREPEDMDVLTIFERPPALADDDEAFAATVVRLGWFDQRIVKQRDRLDVYFIDLSAIPQLMAVGDAARWAGLYGIRRDGLAKGFLRIPLHSPQDDAGAVAWLDAEFPQDGGPQ